MDSLEYLVALLGGALGGLQRRQAVARHDRMRPRRESDAVSGRHLSAAPPALLAIRAPERLAGDRLRTQRKRAVLEDEVARPVVL
jgi:hypothetical protein